MSTEYSTIFDDILALELGDVSIDFRMDITGDLLAEAVDLLGSLKQALSITQLAESDRAAVIEYLRLQYKV